jgi:hypothetical protein
MRQVIRGLAMALNVVALTIIAAHYRDFGDFKSASDLGIGALILFTPILSLLGLIEPRLRDAAGWLELWLRRKTAEERKKLRDIESGTP